MQAPELQTERLILRQFAHDDCDRLCRLAGHRRVYETTLEIPHPYTADDAEAWIGKSEEMCREGSAIHLAIALRPSSQLIGGIGLTIARRHDRAELGFWIGVPHWTQGYATEAGRAMLHFGFTELALERIWAGHMRGNEASARVQEKLGMQREGVLRRQFKKDVRYHDNVIYAIVRADWEAMQ